MSELFSVIKTALFSVIFLMLLQIQWQGRSLESYSREFIYRSQVGNQVQEIAVGLAHASREGWDRVSTWAKMKTQSQLRDRVLNDQTEN